MDVLIWAMFTVGLFQQVSGLNGKVQAGPVECPIQDNLCENDKMGYEAINSLHAQIDDDKNGGVTLSESDEFIRDELKYTDDFERHTKFHRKDEYITAEELWRIWTNSHVYNWTVDDTIEWLVTSVELPQYAEVFKLNAVDGHSLPRIASNNAQYLTKILGIKNNVNRQKLCLKAMDVVLFGPPKKGHSLLKDLALVISLVIAVGGCWMAYSQNKHSQAHIKKVMKDMEVLQKAEDSLLKLQDQLERAQEDHKTVAVEKESLEKKMNEAIKTSKSEAENLKSKSVNTEELISRLKTAEDELALFRTAHRDGIWRPPHELQYWLQLTYEIENKHYETKKEAAQRQLTAAKETCEKIRKKRSSFMGAIRIAHSSSIDDVDHSILAARGSLEEVRNDLQERQQRWQEIENHCDFCIINNPGVAQIEALLGLHPSHHANHSASATGAGNLAASKLNIAPLAVDDNDEDIPPAFTQVAGGRQMSSQMDLRHRGGGLPSAYSASTLITASTPNIHTTASGTHLNGATSHLENISASDSGESTHSCNEAIPSTNTPVCFNLGENSESGGGSSIGSTGGVSSIGGSAPVVGESSQENETAPRVLIQKSASVDASSMNHMKSNFSNDTDMRSRSQSDGARLNNRKIGLTSRGAPQQPKLEEEDNNSGLDTSKSTESLDLLDGTKDLSPKKLKKRKLFGNLLKKSSNHNTSS
ncbi:unnamed protein product [Owenia fusiformis]|uniref:Uncharacterized protein n=1 Tax=Owenia fusiformis TaxID=6347 RepID=A0A8J1TJ27_OWEFU|nr:unnamed protein product [Owenia fusiformis]